MKRRPRLLLSPLLPLALVLGVDTVSLHPAFARILFSSPRLDLGISSTSIAMFDFNRDGRADLAVASVDPSNQQWVLSVLAGLGDGTFSARIVVTTGTGYGPTFVLAADANADGADDLFVANAGSHDVSVFLGHGDLSF